MPLIVPEDGIKQAIAKSTFIQSGIPENAEGVKYDFRMSPRILKAKYNQPIDITDLPAQERASLAVEPGEVVFVLTEEKLTLPDDMMATLSPKRKLSHDGIMVLGGFCVDPGYTGRLLIGLYNFSSTNFPLTPGKKLIAALFYKLQPAELGQFNKPETSIQDFPDELVRLMQNYTPVHNARLVEQFAKLSVAFDALRDEFRARDNWFEKFEKSIDEHAKLITKILAGLEKEKEARESAEARSRGDMDAMRRDVASYAKEAYKIAGILAGIAAVVGVIAALIIPWLQRLASN